MFKNWFNPCECQDISKKIKDALLEYRMESEKNLSNANHNLELERTKTRGLEREISELKPKLRVQTEADILLLCKRIEAKVIAGAKEEELKEDQSRLMALQNLYAQESLSGYQGIGSASGFLRRL